MAELNRYISNLITALIDGKRDRCAEIFHKSRSLQITPVEIYEDLFKPALYKIGELWEYNKISVATEHMATAIIEDLMGEMFNEFFSPHKVQKTIVVSSVEDETHQIGGRMVADIFEKHGLNSLFLGANTPLYELIRFISDKKPDAVALSIAVYFHIPILHKTIKHIRSIWPELPIFIGGQALIQTGSKIVRSYTHVMYAPTLFELEHIIKDYNKAEKV